MISAILLATVAQFPVYVQAPVMTYSAPVATYSVPVVSSVPMMTYTAAPVVYSGAAVYSAAPVFATVPMYAGGQTVIRHRHGLFGRDRTVITNW